MNTVEALMRDYLIRLEAAAAGLPDEVRRDVLDDVETHLEEVLAGDPSEAEVLEALDRLGTAEEIAASAGSAAHGGEGGLQPASPSGEAAHPGRTAARGWDVATILLLVSSVPVTLLLGPVGVGVWLLAVVLLWASPAWTAGEKAFATLVWPGGVAFPLQAVMALGTTCTTAQIGPGSSEGGAALPVTCSDGFPSVPLWIGVPLWAALLGAPVVVGIVLLRRAHRRAAVGPVQTAFGRGGVA